MHSKRNSYAKDMFNIAAVSATNIVGDKESTLMNYEKWIIAIQEQHPEVNLILFPELGIPGFWVNEEVLSYAESIPGSSTNRLCDLAKTYHINLAVGIAEKDNNEFYITHVFVTPEGLLGKYRKVTLNLNMMGKFFSCGDQFPVFEIEGVRIGINICADNTFPTNAHLVAANGANILLAPYASHSEHAKSWTDNHIEIVRKSAERFGLYIIACNHSGNITLPNNNESSFPGGHFALSPTGEILRRSIQVDNNTEELMYLSIDKSTLVNDKMAKEPLNRHFPYGLAPATLPDI